MQKVYLTIFLLYLPVAVFSQNLNFEFDYAQFGYDTLSNYVEFYYSYDKGSLSYVDTDTTDYVGGILHIEITDSASGDTVIDKHWMVNSEISDSSELNQNLIGVLGFVLKEGSYKAIVTGLDANNRNNERSITEFIYIQPLIKPSLAISDIQLASKIIPGSET